MSTEASESSRGLEPPPAEEAAGGGSDDNRDAAAPPVVADEVESDEAVKKSQSQSPPSSSSSGGRRLLPLLQAIVALVAGGVGGAFLAAHLLESEYQTIVSRLHSDYQSTILRTQNDYIACQSTLSEEKRTHSEEASLLRIRADQNERAFRTRAEQYLNETNAAYFVANDGLEKAASLLRREALDHDDTRVKLAQTEEMLHVAETEAAEYHRTHEELVRTISERDAMASDREAARLELSQAERRIQAIRNTVAESSRATEECRAELEGARKELRAELDVLERELDQRDEERLECVKTQRDLDSCRESLGEALVDLDVAGATTTCEGGEGEEAAARLRSIMEVNAARQTSLMEENAKLEEKARSLEEENAELEGRARSLEGEAEVREAAMEELNSNAQNWRREGAEWYQKAASMKEKISYRSRKEVLEQYGPGPYHIQMTVAFPTPPERESIVFELAPLDLMPHTVHTILDMVRRGTYDNNTFVLARAHIIVGGPIDEHDLENNARLQGRMREEGYWPSGALLFKEYSPDYPHAPGTIGFNPDGGPVFYLNLGDNSQHHGPVEGVKEGDPCWAKLVEGIEVIRRISEQPKRDDGESFAQAVYIVESRVVNNVEV